MTAFFMTLLILVLIVIVIDIYFWPFNIAIRKKVEDKLAVFIINLILAWTVIGWIICLMWAISLTDERSEEEKEENKKIKNENFKFLRKYWKILLGVILAIAIIAGIGSEMSKNTKTSTQETQEITSNKYTNCEIGDLIGDDVETINYKNLIVDYHSTEFSAAEIKKLASECYKDGATTQEQMSCCTSQRMYP